MKPKELKAAIAELESKFAENKASDYDGVQIDMYKEALKYNAYLEKSLY